MSHETETKHVRTNSLGWMIQRISGRLDRVMAERLRAHDLTLQQFAVLMTVLEAGGLTQVDIGARFGMPAYTISRAIDQLESRGLLQRRAHPNSRRALTIHATQAAIELRHSLFEIVQETNAEVFEPLSADESATFKALLSRLF